MIILILSFIQGITEFLPVSSSGHLILLPYVVGWQGHSLEIDGILHLGTLFAVIIYFWKDIVTLVGDFFTFLSKPSKATAKTRQNAYMCFSILIATIPVVIAGFFLKRFGIEGIRSSIHIIALSGIFWGGVLWLSDQYASQKRTLTELNFKDALIIGIFQIFSLIPGSSRSGMCMMGGRLRNFDRESAARFAFLLAIPAISGAFTLIAFDAYRDGVQTPAVELGAYLGLSFMFGLSAIHFMMRFVMTHSLKVFGVYRIILGLFTLYFMADLSLLSLFWRNSLYAFTLIILSTFAFTIWRGRKTK